MYMQFQMRFGSGFSAPGCVVLPGISRSFGFSGSSGSARDRRFGFVRVLLALLSVVALVWGTVYGHAVECIAAVIAAVLVDALAGLLRGRAEA
ncbi:hypothetical protein [Streptomyces sp. NPDC058653]|uniref:hypothetical protein n=1 Tax=Streptomyces sp. NPDC058653 TaxID=3346576 RepID=UPI003666C5E2